MQVSCNRIMRFCTSVHLCCDRCVCLCQFVVLLCFHLLAADVCFACDVLDRVFKYGVMICDVSCASTGHAVPNELHVGMVAVIISAVYCVSKFFWCMRVQMFRKSAFLQRFRGGMIAAIYGAVFQSAHACNI